MCADPSGSNVRTACALFLRGCRFRRTPLSLSNGAPLRLDRRRRQAGDLFLEVIFDERADDLVDAAVVGEAKSRRAGRAGLMRPAVDDRLDRRIGSPFDAPQTAAGAMPLRRGGHLAG